MVNAYQCGQNLKSLYLEPTTFSATVCPARVFVPAKCKTRCFRFISLIYLLPTLLPTTCVLSQKCYCSHSKGRCPSSLSVVVVRRCRRLYLLSSHVGTLRKYSTILSNDYYQFISTFYCTYEFNASPETKVAF